MIFSRPVREETSAVALKNAPLGDRLRELIWLRYQNKQKLRKIVAILCVMLAIGTWMAMSIRLKIIEVSFPRSFFITAVVHTWWSIALIPWFIWRRSMKKGLNEADLARAEESLGIIPSPRSSRKFPGVRLKGEASVRYLASTGSFSKDHVRYLILAIIVFLSGWFWYVSIPLTSLGVNTAIYQSSVAFVYIFSILFLGEHHRWFKSGAVVVCMSGVLFIALYTQEKSADILFTDTAEILPTEPFGLVPLDIINEDFLVPEDFVPPERRLLGLDFLPAWSQKLVGVTAVTLSMLLYSLFEVLYKLCTYPSEMTLGSEGKVHEVYRGHPHLNIEGIRAMGIMGAWSSLAFVFLPVLSILGLEEFTMPSAFTWVDMSFVGVLDCLYNLLILVAIGLSSPLLVAVVLLLAMPISLLIDFFVSGEIMRLPNVAGCCLIITGVLIMIIGGSLRMAGKNLKEMDIEDLETEDLVGDACIVEPDDFNTDDAQEIKHMVKGWDITPTRRDVNFGMDHVEMAMSQKTRSRTVSNEPTGAIR